MVPTLGPRVNSLAGESDCPPDFHPTGADTSGESGHDLRISQKKKKIKIELRQCSTCRSDTLLLIQMGKMGKYSNQNGIMIVILIHSMEQLSHETRNFFCNIKVHRSDLKEKSAGRLHGLMI